MISQGITKGGTVNVSMKDKEIVITALKKKRGLSSQISESPIIINSAELVQWFVIPAKAGIQKYILYKQIKSEQSRGLFEDKWKQWSESEIVLHQVNQPCLVILDSCLRRNDRQGFYLNKAYF